MARLILQKNGLFAVYSSNVSNVITYDATEEELIAMARQEAANRAEDRMRDQCRKAREHGDYIPPDKAVEWIRGIHGAEEAEIVRKLLAGEGDPPGR